MTVTYLCDASVTRNVARQIDPENRTKRLKTHFILHITLWMPPITQGQLDLDDQIMAHPGLDEVDLMMDDYVAPPQMNGNGDDENKNMHHFAHSTTFQMQNGNGDEGDKVGYMEHAGNETTKLSSDRLLSTKEKLSLACFDS